MPFYKVIKFCCFFFLWFNSAFSQNYPVKNYTAANELPNNAVRSLLVDSNNVLWIGTENGVVKKENDDFKYFFEEDGLALNSCWAIAEDSNKNLWFGSYGAGISIFNGRDFKVISGIDGLVHNEITSLFSRGNKMFVGTSDGISVVDINSFKVHSLKYSAGNELFRIQDFFIYQNQVYVASYISGVFKISFENDRPILVRVNDKVPIYSVLVEKDSIYSSNKGFFSKNSLAEFVDKGNSDSEKRLGTSIIWNYIKTSDNRIFAGAWGIYDTNGGIFEIKDNKMISRASQFDIPSREVLCLAYNPTFERLYVGTKDAGLFEVVLDPQIKFNEIDGINVLGFARTENSSAVLLSDGISLKAGSNEKKISLQQLKKWQENYVRKTKLPLPRHEDHFYELDYSTKAENIGFYDIKVFGNVFWVNTNIGIFAINNSGELLRYLPVHSEEINFTPTGKLIETNPYGGVRIYNDLDSFSYTSFHPEDPSTPTMVVNSLQKNDKTYFLSVFSGLYVWENDKFKSYVVDDSWEEKKLRHMTTLGEDLAVSSEFGDVFILKDDPEFKLLQKIPRANIQGNTISFLKEYRGNLIVGTEKGLTLFKDDRKIFLDEEQGLKQPLHGAEVNGDHLNIGSNNGYYSLDLKSLFKECNLVEDLEIKEIFINNNELLSQQRSEQEELELAHNQNTVLLRFGTNSHPFPNKLKYQYKLNEKDNWSLPTDKPEIFLPFLTPNDYEITVRVLDQSTGLSYTQPLLRLSILQPFWKTWWFFLLILCAILLVVFSVYKIQIRQNKRFEAQKRIIQKRFEETKMEALLAQMNPHFIFNAMNSIQNYILDSDIDNANLFLGDFAKLIRLNLDHCTRPTILLIEEIEYLQSYTRVENTRFNNAVKVIFDIDKELDVYEVEIPTMLLQTFVENVFVHAFPNNIEDPTLEISFKLLPGDILECKIKDNGVGFQADTSNKLHNSKGIKLVKERLTLLGYDLEKTVRISAVKGKGTTLVLRLQV
ncbi:histidine kinase [Salinimicrobium sp. HB62]|uniref:histidine kinase n=1 Tax=Salinimicrobium sp. HB62 TaxID=3077781 RepID=UPI002D785183|nr:histidine kinase [Salinimicrobium sp. HB62]